MLSSIIRRPCLLLAAVLAGQFWIAYEAHAARFVFDTGRTSVSFAYTMLFVRHQGRFTEVSGLLDYDEARPEASRIAATIKTASLTTGREIIDRELKSPSFFNAKASPVIAFESRTVAPQGDGVAEVSGDITINGVTRPAILDITVEPNSDPDLKHEAGARMFVAKTRIRRSDFNMSDWAMAVADEVDIEIAGVLRPRK